MITPILFRFVAVSYQSAMIPRSSSFVCRLLFSLGQLLLGATSLSAKDTSIDLIDAQHPTVSDPLITKLPYAALSDGNTSRPAEFASGKSPVEIVYNFGDQVVSPSGIIVHWSPSANAPAAPSIEILVSTLAADAGFQSLRTAHLKSKAGEQKFSFVPKAANWLMVRIIPAPSAENASLAELEIRGALGPPESNYEFKESPADAFDVLSKLKGMILSLIHI